MAMNMVIIPPVSHTAAVLRSENRPSSLRLPANPQPLAHAAAAQQMNTPHFFIIPAVAVLTKPAIGDRNAVPEISPASDRKPVTTGKTASVRTTIF